MSTFIINGQTFTTSGQNISIINGVVSSNGTVITTITGNAEITWNGPLANLETDCSVTCGDIHGNVSAGNTVKANNITGKVTAGNSVKANGLINGSAHAGNSVKIN